MSHHEANHQETPYNEAEADGNSRADAFAIFGLVVVVVAMAVYYVSR